LYSGQQHGNLPVEVIRHLVAVAKLLQSLANTSMQASFLQVYLEIVALLPHLVSCSWMCACMCLLLCSTFPSQPQQQHTSTAEKERSVRWEKFLRTKIPLYHEFIAGLTSEVSSLFHSLLCSACTPANACLVSVSRAASVPPVYRASALAHGKHGYLQFSRHTRTTTPELPHCLHAAWLISLCYSLEQARANTVTMEEEAIALTALQHFVSAMKSKPLESPNGVPVPFLMASVSTILSIAFGIALQAHNLCKCVSVPERFSLVFSKAERLVVDHFDSINRNTSAHYSNSQVVHCNRSLDHTHPSPFSLSQSKAS
jgi:hypothetical protein